MNEQNIEVITGGLKCDNPSCDWVDATVKDESLSDWINKPCPKCGENVLTERDYMNAKLLLAAAEIANSIPPDKMKQIDNLEDMISALKENALFKDAKGLDDLKDGGVIVTIDTHKEIKVTEIKNV